MWNKETVAAVLAGASLLGLLGATALLVFGKIPPENKDLFNVALMAIVGNTGTAFGFFLGGVANHPPKPPDVKDVQ